MIPWVISASYIEDYRIHMTFNDGATGEIDFANEFDGEFFEALKDNAYFQKFRIEGHTLCLGEWCRFRPRVFEADVVPGSCPPLIHLGTSQKPPAEQVA
ncbi:MAG: DUF2442 domain-containing protein [Candidatus Hydrogenedentes bacterium]|nr:DUF2442 domain-containing protein [Candidatus Hydrogenedentota bacterium]